LRARATTVVVEGIPIIVASLADIIKSKRAAGRQRDKAVLDMLEKALEEKGAQKPETGRASKRK
jgi:hypothetical protein